MGSNQNNWKISEWDNKGVMCNQEARQLYCSHCWYFSLQVFPRTELYLCAVTQMQQEPKGQKDMQNERKIKAEPMKGQNRSHMARLGKKQSWCEGKMWVRVSDLWHSMMSICRLSFLIVGCYSITEMQKWSGQPISHAATTRHVNIKSKKIFSKWL